MVVKKKKKKTTIYSSILFKKNNKISRYSEVRGCMVKICPFERKLSNELFEKLHLNIAFKGS